MDTASHYRKIEAGWKIAVPMIDMQTLERVVAALPRSMPAVFCTWAAERWG